MDYSLDDEGFDALMDAANEGNVGPDNALACNVDADEHIHVRRLGAVGSALEGRVALMAHGANGHAIIYLAAAQARAYASAVLDAADEIDGTTPLVFMPRTPDEAALPAEEVEEAPESRRSALGAVTGFLVGLALAPVVRRLL